MKGTRTGKIARLPREIRDELNRRLDEGKAGKKIVVWLNGLPEVEAIIATEFNGKPIREQNVSEWKKGGYLDHVTQQETLQIAKCLAEDAAQWSDEGQCAVADTIAFFLLGRYALATRQLRETKGREAWHMLRQMCDDVIELQKGQHSAERLRIDRERLQLEKEKSEKRINEKVAEIVKQHGASEGLSQEERNSRMREIFGLPPAAKRNGGLSPGALAEIERAAKFL